MAATQGNPRELGHPETHRSCSFPPPAPSYETPRAPLLLAGDCTVPGHAGAMTHSSAGRCFSMPRSFPSPLASPLCWLGCTPKPQGCTLRFAGGARVLCITHHNGSQEPFCQEVAEGGRPGWWGEIWPRARSACLRVGTAALWHCPASQLSLCTIPAAGQHVSQDTRTCPRLCQPQTQGFYMGKSAFQAPAWLLWTISPSPLRHSHISCKAGSHPVDCCVLGPLMPLPGQGKGLSS